MSQDDKEPVSHSSKAIDFDKMDSSTVNKLIPQMFDQMRSNLGMKGFDQVNDSRTAKNSSNSLVNTQSMLKELETLDKLIPMFESLNDSLQKSVPSHLERIHEICKSTSTTLDSWVNIQSQAGYINKLMDSEAYLEYSDAQLRKGDSAKAEALITEKTREIESLKQQVEAEKLKRISANESNSSDKTFGAGRPGSSGRVAKSTVNKPALSSRMKRPSAIPKVTSRLTRPTASSSRKMFR